MVVGGTRGIGLAVAELLTTLGAGVVVNGRDAGAAAQAAQRLPRAVALAGSPAEPAVADALIDTCIGEFGGIDVLVNCAGIAGLAGESILTVTSAAFRELIDAHLGTTFETEHGVRANVVCPGAKTRLSTGTDYEHHIAELNRRGLLDDASMQAALDAPAPEYAAPTYAYLASDLAQEVTGQIFIAAGNFVGRFDRQTPSILAYRGHDDSPPWTVDEIHGFVTR